MRSVRGSSIAVAVLAGLLAVAPAAAAHAEDPVSFGASPVVDTVDALSASELTEVEAAIERAADDTGRQLFVAFVDEFTNPADAASWATDTANANNMGTEDYLLAVAVEGRSYYFSAAPDASLTQADTDRISIERIEPRLRDEDWAGAAVAAAQALGGGGGGGGFGAGFLWILLGGAAVIAVVAVVLARRRRRDAGAPGIPGGAPGADAEAQVPLEELRRRAASALVQADDALKTSEEELGFATAGYGEEATAGFRSALETAKARVAEAFTLQQRLDDHEPDTEQQQREWYTAILALTAEAESMLDAEADRFDALRDLEQNAPQALARVEAAARAAEDGIAPAAQRLQALGAQYAASALATVADNPEQARTRIAFVRDSIGEARAALERGESGAAAVDIRAAEEATDQARLLTAAIERLAADLAQGDRAVAAGVGDLDADVRTARGLPDASLAGLADRVEAESAAIRAELARPGRSPLDLAARVDRVNAEIDRAVKGARDAQVQAERTRAELDRSLLAARSGAGRRGLPRRAPRRHRLGGPDPARRGRPPRRRGAVARGIRPAPSPRERPAGRTARVERDVARPAGRQRIRRRHAGRRDVRPARARRRRRHVRRGPRRHPHQLDDGRRRRRRHVRRRRRRRPQPGRLRRGLRRRALPRQLRRFGHARPPRQRRPLLTRSTAHTPRPPTGRKPR